MDHKTNTGNYSQHKIASQAEFKITKAQMDKKNISSKMQCHKTPIDIFALQEINFQSNLFFDHNYNFSYSDMGASPSCNNHNFVFSSILACFPEGLWWDTNIWSSFYLELTHKGPLDVEVIRNSGETAQLVARRTFRGPGTDDPTRSLIQIPRPALRSACGLLSVRLNGCSHHDTTLISLRWVTLCKPLQSARLGLIVIEPQLSDVEICEYKTTIIDGREAIHIQSSTNIDLNTVIRIASEKSLDCSHFLILSHHDMYDATLIKRLESRLCYAADKDIFRLPLLVKGQSGICFVEGDRSDITTHDISSFKCADLWLSPAPSTRWDLRGLSFSRRAAQRELYNSGNEMGQATAIWAPSMPIWVSGAPLAVRDHANDVNELQQILWPGPDGDPMLPSEMFVHCDSAGFTFADVVSSSQNDILGNESFLKPIPLANQITISFDSFINSFYESYWSRFTTVDDVCVCLEVEGEIRVEICRHARFTGRDVPVLTVLSKNIGQFGRKSHHVLKVPPPAANISSIPSAFGRLWLVVQGVSNDARLLKASWATTKHAERCPMIGVVMCTFNKPREVLRNLHSVASLFETYDELKQFVVVDQGSEKVRSCNDFKTLDQYPAFIKKLRIVEQPNLGGAGGFTRGIMETYINPAITHVLLMDDDVIIPSFVLPRLLSVLTYLKDPAVVGGQMFDMFFPHMMHAHSERFNPATLLYEAIIPHGQNLKLRRANDIFLEVSTGTYNGWWLCCFNRELFEQHGLPLPFFVRCDDGEFGTRLSSSGEKIITFPGIFIWHEPFYSKIVGWMIYYECRNTIIMAMLRWQPFARSQLVSYLKRFYGYLASNLFDHAMAMVLALEHMLEGPEAVFKDTEARHKSVLQALAPLKPHTAPGQPDGINPHLSSRISERWPRVARRLSSLWWTFWAAPAVVDNREIGELGQMQHFSWLYTHRRPVLRIYNHYTEQVYTLRPNPKIARQLLLRLFKAMYRWQRHAKELQKEYINSSKKRASFSEWVKYLEAEGAKDVDHLKRSGSMPK